MKTYVRLPSHQVNKVVLHVNEEWVAEVFGKFGALPAPSKAYVHLLGTG